MERGSENTTGLLPKSLTILAYFSVASVNADAFDSLLGKL